MLIRKYWGQKFFFAFGAIPRLWRGKRDKISKIARDVRRRRTKKTKGEAKFPYAALAAEGGAASAANPCLILEH